MHIMIERLDPTQQIQNLPCITSVKYNFKNFEAKDQLTSLQKRSPIFNRLLTFFLKFWNWFKYHILFFFFDEGEDIDKELKKELCGYWDSFDLLAVEETPAGQETLRKKFGKLSFELRELLKEQMYLIFEEVNPQMTKKDLLGKVDQVLANPFFKLQDNSKEPSEREISAMGRALAKATEKLSGY